MESNAIPCGSSWSCTPTASASARLERGGSWVETQAEEARFEPGDTALEDDHSATRTAIRTVDYVSSKR